MQFVNNAIQPTHHHSLPYLHCQAHGFITFINLILRSHPHKFPLLSVCIMHWSQMLINQSSLMLQYCQSYPIRLLSLPSQQQHMVQRLKMAKQRLRRSQTLPTQPPFPTTIATSQPSSVRFNMHGRYRPDRRSPPLPSPLDLSCTIHSKTKKDSHRTKLSILEEQPSRLSVIKQIMQKNSPFNLTKLTQNGHPGPTIKIRRFQRKDSLLQEGKREKLRRQWRENGLRDMMIINRVRQSKSINLVISKISCCKQPIPL